VDKGRDEFCCCNGCQCKPEPSSLSGINGSPEYLSKQTIWRRFCCSCVPKQACVTITYKENSNTYNYFLYYPPSAPPQDLDQALYVPESGQSVYIGDGEIIDLSFHFKIRNGSCYFSLASESLGIDLENQYYDKIIDADTRKGPDFFCKTLSTDGLGYTLFQINDDLQITISAANHVPILGRKNCYDQYGNIVFDESPLRNLCCNCSCICECMYLNYGGTLLFIDDNNEIIDNQVAIQSTACLNNYNDNCSVNWLFDMGVTLSIKTDYNKCLLEDMLSCYKLDEQYGDRIDSMASSGALASGGFSSNGRTLSSINNVSYSSGKIGNSAYFNGSNYLIWLDEDPIDRIRLEDSDGAILLWCKLDSINNDMCILSKYSDQIQLKLVDDVYTYIDVASYEISFDASDNKFIFKISNGSQEFTVSSTYKTGIVANTWYSIYAEIDNTNKKIAIKVGDDQFYSSSFSGSLQDVRPALYLGRSGNSTNYNYLSGQIDQVLIWARVLGKSTIKCCDNISDYNLRLSEVDKLINNNFIADTNDIITCNFDKRCYAHLDVGELDITSTPQPILLGSELLNTKCPSPELVWNLTHAADEFISQPYPVVFTFRCKNCDNIPTVYIDSCCYTGRTNFPTSLRADISTDCPGCPSITIGLIWQGYNSYYEGVGYLCGQQILVRVACPFNEIYINWGLCFAGNISADSSNCDPILITGSAQSAGLGCCPSDPFLNPILSITIYE
jgi:hypothetical protein